MRLKKLLSIKTLGITLVFLILMANGKAYATYIIDPFSDDSITTMTQGSVGSQSQNSPAPSAMNGTGAMRFEYLELISTGGLSNELEVSAGSGNYAEKPNVEGTAYFEWYADAAHNPLPNIDLTQGGLNQYIKLRIIFSDLVGEDIKLTIGDGSTTKSVSQNLPQILSPVTYSFPFASFPGVLMNSVDYIRLDVDFTNSAKGNDISVDFLGADIPEPGTLILLGSGLLGLAGYVRRRKKKA